MEWSSTGSWFSNLYSRWYEQSYFKVDGQILFEGMQLCVLVWEVKPHLPDRICGSPTCPSMTTSLYSGWSRWWNNLKKSWSRSWRRAVQLLLAGLILALHQEPELFISQHLGSGLQVPVSYMEAYWWSWRWSWYSLAIPKVQSSDHKIQQMK